MIDELPVMEICVGAAILFVLLIIIILIIRNRPFTYNKRTHEKKTTLTIVAKKNLHKVTVEARFDKDQITFERKRIRKRQSVEFTYPASDKPAKVIIEIEAGKKPKVFEV